MIRFVALGVGLIGLGALAGRIARALGDLVDTVDQAHRTAVRGVLPDLDGEDVLSTALRRIRDEAEHPDDAVAGFGSSV